jgi:hypothetical protein
MKSLEVTIFLLFITMTVSADVVSAYTALLPNPSSLKTPRMQESQPIESVKQNEKSDATSKKNVRPVHYRKRDRTKRSFLQLLSVPLRMGLAVITVVAVCIFVGTTFYVAAFFGVFGPMYFF